MSTRTPKIGRPFVAVHTAVLSDARLKMAGNAARLVFHELKLIAAIQGTDGLVPKNPRELQINLQLDGGLAEVKEAIAALVEAGKLEDSGAQWLLTDWSTTQADLGGSSSRSASAGPAQLRRYHLAGKHEGHPREACQLCQEGVSAAPVELPVATPLTAPEPTEATQAPDQTADMDPGAKELEREFRECFPAVFRSVERLEGYRELFRMADRLGTEQEDLSPKLRGLLMNVVLEDALTHYLGDVIEGQTFAICFRGAKALSEQDGAFWWTLAAQRAATQSFESPKHAVAWLTTVAANLRAESKAGAA